MKKINKILSILGICTLVLIFSSCESYLDREEDEQLTFDKIWMKEKTIKGYLKNVWGHMLKDDDIEDGHPFIAAADDVVLTYNRNYRWINYGTWNASAIPYSSKMWIQFYKGIHEATIFYNNVDIALKYDIPNLSPETITQWKTEARFVRAYLYFQLLKIYGPIPLLYDDLIDPNDGDIKIPRNTFEECALYIQSELEACEKVFPINYPKDNLVADQGKPTKGTCRALIGRLKLYSARPLFNGSKGLYNNVKNHDGENIFPTSYDPNKWKEAADYYKAFLADFDGSVYKLYSTSSPYTSYQGVFTEVWNDELILARWNTGYDLRVLLTPAVVGGTCYGASGPTQEQVDAYGMHSSGKYPITGYSPGGAPIIDPASGYPSDEFTLVTSFTHPLDNRGANLATPKMFLDRDPRLYVSVLWSNAYWVYTGNTKVMNYAYNGNSGPGPRHDFPTTGYMTRKYLAPSLNTAGGTWGNITFPVIRLAEVYLNYVEALNESDPGNSDILTYLNKIRNRSGMPNLEVAYPEVASLSTSTQDKMRELIRKERQVELFFECHRYFDIRTWMIGEETISEPVHGMNIMAKSPSANVTPEDFWKRVVADNRVFRPNFYLYPIASVELVKNKALVQNFGW